MDAGTTFAQQYQLRPGVSLSAQQMAQLTSDIVWLVEQTVTLPDGSTTQALVPQVYARMKAGDLDGTGTLLAGQVTNLNLTGDMTNTGTVAGRTIVNLTAENVNNLGGRISANDTSVTARTDLNNIGGTIDGVNSLTAIAGRDLNIASTTSSASNYTEGTTVNNFSLTGIDRIAGLYVTSQTGTTLVASAGRDLNIVAGVIANNGATGNTTVTAQRDLNLGTVGTSSSSSVVRGAGTDFLEDRQTADVGSQINTQGNLNLSAGRDLNAKAANVQAAGDLTAVAGNNINISNGRQTNSTSFGLTSNDGDLFSSSSTTERRSGEQSNAVSSSIGGKTVTSVAGNDQTVTGSSVISDAGTTLSAGKNLTIQAATNTSKSSDFKETKEEGLMGSGSAGVTIGSQEQSLEQKNSGTTAAASTVGSIAGNVTLVANEAYKQVGSDVQAPGGNIDIRAKTVEIVEARETSQTVVEQKFKQSGLTFEVVSPVISAMQAAQQQSEASENTSSNRAKNLAAANTALAANKAADAVKAGQGTRINGKDGQIATKVDSEGNVLEQRDANAADKAGGIDLAISIGGSESQSRQDSQSDTARGSTVSAAGNVNIQATGAGKDSNLTIRGSTVEGLNVQLSADNEVKLQAAQNTASQNSTNSSSSGSVGISIGTSGFLFNASGSKGRGKSDGNDTSYTNTEIKAGTQVAITSGGDTTLQGAVVRADQVKADVGGNLKIESLQDTSTYTSEQKSASASISIGFGKGSGSISASNSNINSDFRSVGEQSGIKAGDGGFQVNVQGNTALTGGVIASNQAAVDQGKNSFSTGGTLTATDVQNSASYEGKSSSFGIGGGGQANAKGISGLGIGWGQAQGDASSTTSAGISGIAGNTAVRSTDAETGLKPIFDAAKVQRDIDAQAQITQAFTRDATKAVGDFAQVKLSDAKALRRQADDQQEPAVAAALKAQAQDLEDTWGEGKFGRVLLHTLVGGLAGGTAGAAGAATSASAAPLISDLQTSIELGLRDAGMSADVARGVAQSIATLTAAGAGSVVGGAQGAAAAAVADANNRALHAAQINRIKDLANKDPKKEFLLTAAGCALLRCADGVPKDDPAYTILKALQDYGAGLTVEKTLLSQQRGWEGRSFGSLFQYTGVDEYIADPFTQNKVDTRLGGVVQGVAGTAGVLGSAGLCSTGLGCFAAGVTGTISADYAQAGVKQALTGNATQPYGEQVLQCFGLSPAAAAITYAALGVTPAAFGAIALNKAVNAEAAANAWARGIYTGESAINYAGTIYRYSDPKYASTTWEIYPGNVSANHRYSPPGSGAIYAGTTEQTARAEVASYVPLDGKVLISGDVKIDRVLDLTDPAALKALGVTKQEITLSSHGANGVYNQTQRIAEWAREQGYNGILAPSAQNKTGTNLITFDSLVPRTSTGVQVITPSN